VTVGGALAPQPLAYKEALAWLYSLQRFGIKLGLDNIRRLLKELHVDPAGLGFVFHVAGTNGKGSVCAMLDSICRAANYRTALYTSPHLVTFRERIRINGEMISEDAVARGLIKIRNLVRGWNPHPTFFEVVTALALKHFADGKVDIVILETGLGGRLDATNAVRPNVAVLTSIALDHQKWLGDSLTMIAQEKAGIIKAGAPVVSAPQPPEVESVFRDRARDCEVSIEFITESYEQSPVALRGPHQKQNAAVAVGAIRAAEITIDDAAIARGLMSVEWPARFQRWDERTIMDGAHNAAAAEVLAETWRENFADQRATLILAILSDKDLRAICEALARITDFVLLPHIRSERAVDPKTLANELVDLSVKHEVCTDIADSLTKACALSSPILITGSLHFAGETLAYLEGKPAAFEECQQ
jgi:dihydrofolate synthase / folylpolyglutamate synthase